MAVMITQAVELFLTENLVPLVVHVKHLFQFAGSGTGAGKPDLCRMTVC